MAPRSQAKTELASKARLAPFPKPAPDQAPIAYHPFGIKGLDSRPGVDSWTSTSPSLSFHIQGNGDGSNPSEQPLQVGVEMNMNAHGGCKATLHL